MILDAFSRKVIDWALETTLAASLAITALERAIGERCPPPGLVHHSDRGLLGRLNRSSQQIDALTMIDV
jgi:putative transposase